MLPEYLKYWGLSRPPFSLTPDPEMLYMSRQHQEGLIRLKYAVVSNKGGALLISENAGDGKTSLLARLRRELDEYYQGNCHMVFIDHPTLTANQMVGEIARQLGVGGNSTDKLTLLNDLRAFLLDRHQHGDKCVVMLDEGQMLCHRPDLLQELRILLNFCVSDAFLLTFILSGQKPLDEAIRAMPEFYQRLPVRFFLRNLDMDDTRELIRHRLMMAGCTPGRELFSEDGYAGIFNHSKGCPRVICSVADLALVIAHSNFSDRVDFVAVSQATSDMNRTDGAYHYFHFLNSFQPRQAGPAPAKPESIGRGVICTACGEMHEPDASFCPHCGKKVWEKSDETRQHADKDTREKANPEVSSVSQLEEKAVPIPEPEMTPHVQVEVSDIEPAAAGSSLKPEKTMPEQTDAGLEARPEMPEKFVGRQPETESTTGELLFAIQESEYRDPGPKLQQALKFILEGDDCYPSPPGEHPLGSANESLNKAPAIQKDDPEPPQQAMEASVPLEDREEPGPESPVAPPVIERIPESIEAERNAESVEAPLEPPAAPGTVKCGFCGLELSPDTVECPNCGERLRPDYSAPAAEGDDAAQPDASPPAEQSAEDLLLDGLRELQLEKFIPSGQAAAGDEPQEMFHLPRPRFFGRSPVVQYAQKDNGQSYTARCGLKVESGALQLDLGREIDRLEYSRVEEISTDAVTGDGSALLGQLVIIAAKGTYRLTLPFSAETGGRLAGLLQGYIAGKIAPDAVLREPGECTGSRG